MKLFVVLLVVLALLFAVGVGLGSRGGGGGKVSPDEHGWVKTLAKRFGALGGMQPSALSGSCVSGDSLVVAQGFLGCRLEAPRGKRMRNLTLALRQGSQAALDFKPAGGPSLPVRQRLGRGDEVHISVPAEGGSLSVKCLGGGTCVLAAP